MRKLPRQLRLRFRLKESRSKVLKPQGRLTIVGVARSKVAFQSTDLIFKEIDVRGSFICADEFDQTINLLAARKLDVGALVSDVRALDRAVGAMDGMRAGGDMVKILIEPSRTLVARMA